MRWFLAAGFGICFLICFSCTSRIFNDSNVKSSDNIVSLEQDSEGTYTLTCRNGTKEYKTTMVQIRNDQVCKTTTASQPCPLNYVWVPGNATPGLGAKNNREGVSPFCVAQFEMKHPTDETGERQSDFDSTTIPQSVPEKSPWTWITRNQAREACARVRDPKYTFSLMTNGQWQALARTLENWPENWSGGKVGIGVLARGHTDGLPAGKLPLKSTTDAWDGTGNTTSSGWEQRRTHKLPTGTIIWDLSGNAWEWIDEDISALGWDSQNRVVRYLEELTQTNKLIFAPTSRTGAAQNAGVFEYSPWESIIRGGFWRSGANGGLFSVHVGYQLKPWHSKDVGFRCVAIPISQKK